MTVDTEYDAAEMEHDDDDDLAFDQSFGGADETMYGDGGSGGG